MRYNRSSQSYARVPMEVPIPTRFLLAASLLALTAAPALAQVKPGEPPITALTAPLAPIIGTIEPGSTAHCASADTNAPVP